jgi:glycosyltransferase involved in cell wall biosynthesis
MIPPNGDIVIYNRCIPYLAAIYIEIFADIWHGEVYRFSANTAESRSIPCLFPLLRGYMKVSVIMAAYNRSNVLRYAVESLRRSTMTDWELLVIGDACTDDTEDVVTSFGDPRIHFYNMQKNCGEQSGPNNEGLRRAQGEYVAFLSQDDLWFPDHLERLLAAVQQNDADGAFAAGAVFVSDDSCVLWGVGISRDYSPWQCFT